MIPLKISNPKNDMGIQHEGSKYNSFITYVYILYINTICMTNYVPLITGGLYLVKIDIINTHFEISAILNLLQIA